MARVSEGNPLSTGLLQPGWTYTVDDYGLMTGKAIYRLDKDSEQVFRGQDHPVIPKLKAQKVLYSYDRLGYLRADVDYAGIVQESGVTAPAVTASNGLTSAPITTHPNFFSDDAQVAIAGDGTTFNPSSIVPGQFVGGEYGAHFESANGGKFLGFKDPSSTTKQLFFGKSSYLTRETSFQGYVYTNNLTLAKDFLNQVGMSNSVAVFGGMTLLPDFLGPSYVSPLNQLGQLLLAQGSVESYVYPGEVPSAATNPLIVKINYEIRWNRDGYPIQIYPSASE